MAGQVGGPVQAVAVADDYAYVGGGMCLKVLDISDSAHPSEVGSTQRLGYYIEDMAVAGDMAFISAGTSGLYTIDQ